MGQRSVRFPDGLEARAVAVAKAEDRSFSYIVVRALESALRNPSVEREDSRPRDSGLKGSVPSRAPVEKEPLSDRELEGLRNLAESSVEAEVERHQARPAFKCPIPRCEFRALSPAAVCGDHGRTVVPA